MPYKKEVLGYSLVVSAIDHGQHCQGVVHIFSPDNSHLRTIETAARHPTVSDAESVAASLGDNYVRTLVGHRT